MMTRIQREIGRKAFLRCAYFMLAFTFLVTASAQHPGPSDVADRAQIRERIERMFVAYLTAELDISVEMGQQFWPVYNKFSGPIHAADSTVHVSRRELSLAGGEPLEVFKQKLDRLVDAETAFTVLRAEYVRAVAEAFGPGLAVQLLGAKKGFERDMRQHLGDLMLGPNQGTPERRYRRRGEKRR